MSDWYVFDKDPMPELYPQGGPVLVGPKGGFETKAEAQEQANLMHDEDGSGNAVVVQRVDP
jgi:hypothetical protein